MTTRPKNKRQEFYNVFQLDKKQKQCKVGKIPYTSQIFDPDDFDPVFDDEDAFYVRLGCGKNKDYDGKWKLVSQVFDLCYYSHWVGYLLLLCWLSIICPVLYLLVTFYCGRFLEV